MSIQAQMFAFRKQPGLDPIVEPAGVTASKVFVQPLPDGVTTVLVVNSYPVWVRASASALGTPEAGAVLAGEGKDYLFPPYFMGVFATSFPSWVSAIAVARPDYPIKTADGSAIYPDAKIELMYGSGL